MQLVSHKDIRDSITISVGVLRLISMFQCTEWGCNLKITLKCVFWLNESQTAKMLVQVIEKAECEYQVFWLLRIQNAAFTFKQLNILFHFILKVVWYISSGGGREVLMRKESA